jgi:hypothetical protein
MVDLSTVEDQLKAVGCNFRFWGRSELKELCHVLIAGETIAQCVNGTYEAGFAMLCVTDQRVLLVDKKPKYLTLKDIRYEMITELDFSHRMMDATVSIYTPNKSLRFTAYNRARLRKLFHYVQERVVQSRQHPMLGQYTPALEAHIAQLQLMAQNQQLPQPAGPAQDMPEPTFVPNMASKQSYFQQFVPTVSASDDSNMSQAATAQPQIKHTGRPRDGKATAYANMPLIMSGWRRRVYGYHSRSYKEKFEGASS